MEGMLEARGGRGDSRQRAEVRATFKASRVGTIAGLSSVVDGTVRRGAQVRLVRDGTVVYDGRVALAPPLSDDVREVTAASACGIARELRGHQGRRCVGGVRDEEAAEQTLA